LAHILSINDNIMFAHLKVTLHRNTQGDSAVYLTSFISPLFDFQNNSYLWHPGKKRLFKCVESDGRNWGD